MTVSMTTARHSLPLALLSLLLLLPPCALGSSMPGSMLALSAMLEDGALTAVEFQAAKRAVFIEAGLLPPAWPGQSAKEGAQSQQRPGAVVVPGMVPLPEGEGKQGGSGRRGGGGGGGEKARAAGSLYPSGWSLSDEEKETVARKTPRLVFYKLRQVAGTSVADMLLRGYAYLGLKACCEPGCYLCADHNSLSDECLDRACLGGDKSTVKLVGRRRLSPLLAPCVSRCTRERLSAFGSSSVADRVAPGVSGNPDAGAGGQGNFKVPHQAQGSPPVPQGARRSQGGDSRRHSGCLLAGPRPSRRPHNQSVRREWKRDPRAHET